MKVQAIAFASALAATLPLIALSSILAPVAMAQDNPSAKDMKGPPNASGYGREKMGKTTTDDGKAAAGKDMKGPPNADGYEKK